MEQPKKSKLHHSISHVSTNKPLSDKSIEILNKMVEGVLTKICDCDVNHSSDVRDSGVCNYCLKRINPLKTEL